MPPAEVASITVDSGCPVTVAQELLTAMVALADRDPAKVLPPTSSLDQICGIFVGTLLGPAIVKGLL